MIDFVLCRDGMHPVSTIFKPMAFLNNGAESIERL